MLVVTSVMSNKMALEVTKDKLVDALKNNLCLRVL